VTRRRWVGLWARRRSAPSPCGRWSAPDRPLGPQRGPPSVGAALFVPGAGPLYAGWTSVWPFLAVGCSGALAWRLYHGLHRPGGRPGAEGPPGRGGWAVGCDQQPGHAVCPGPGGGCNRVGLHMYTFWAPQPSRPRASSLVLPLRRGTGPRLEHLEGAQLLGGGAQAAGVGCCLGHHRPGGGLWRRSELHAALRRRARR
jgi:hypothetical protein